MKVSSPAVSKSSSTGSVKGKVKFISTMLVKLYPAIGQLLGPRQCT